MNNIDGISWEQRKNDLESSIDDLLEKGGREHEDIYLLMKEMLKTAKIRTSIEEYYEDTLDE